MLLARRGHLCGLVGTHRERLFTEDVFAVFSCFECPFVMHRGRERDVDSIYTIIFQYLLVTGVTLTGAMLLGPLVGAI